MSIPMSRSSAEPTPRQRSILDAALRRFAHYGFRRTSMEEIAREAELSRSALYQHFGSKEEILRALSAHLYAQALAAAEEGASAEGRLDERLYRVLDAKMGFFYELLRGSEHGVEILDENNRLCGDITARSAEAYVGILARVIADGQRRGEFSPQKSGLEPDDTAEFFVRCAEGLTGTPSNSPSPARYRLRLRQLVEVLVTGFGGRRRPTRGRNASGARSAR